jgi:CheY-like chemotaxis protein/HPt (histidine-containing phosphotransfer) domain-containing protein
VLYIDDSPVEQNLMRYYLESCGAQVQIAANGVEGITFAEQGKFIAIVVELAAPGLTGNEIAQTLRSHGSTIPIIGVTADERPEVRDHALKAGCNGVLIKPFDLNSLSAILKKLLPVTCVKQESKPALVAGTKQERLQPLIATFMKDLDRGMKTLNTAIDANDAAAIRKVCLMLKGAAGECGFPQIGSLAQDLLRLMDQEKSVRDLREQVNALVSCCAQAGSGTNTKNQSDSKS